MPCMAIIFSTVIYSEEFYYPSIVFLSIVRRALEYMQQTEKSVDNFRTTIAAGQIELMLFIFLYRLGEKRADEVMWYKFIILLLLAAIAVELVGADCDTLKELCHQKGCNMPPGWCLSLPLCPNCHR